MAEDKPIKLKVEEEGVRQTSKDLQGLSKSLNTVKVTGVAAMGAVATSGLAAGAAIKVMIDRMVGVIDEMNTLGAAANITGETMNGLRFIADSTGKSLGAMVPKDLVVRLKEARESAGGARKDFTDLGFSMAEINNLSTDEALFKVVDSLNKMDDQQQAAAISAKLLGGEGREMMSAFGGGLGDLKRANQLMSDFGYDIGPDAQKAASDWQMANARLNLSLENTYRKMGPVVTVATKLTKSFATGLVAATTAVETQMGELYDRMELFLTLDWGTLTTRMSGDLLGLGGVTEAVAEQMDKWLNTQDELTGDGKGSLPKVAEETDKTTTKVKGFTKEVEKVLPSLASLQLRLAGFQDDAANTIAIQLDVDLEDINEQMDAVQEAMDKASGPDLILMQEKMDTLVEMRVAAEQQASNRIAEITSEASEQAATVAEEEEESWTKRLQKKITEAAEVSVRYHDTAAQISGAFADASSSIVDSFDKQSEGGKKAARNMFQVMKAANVSNIVVSTLAGIQRQFAENPWPVALVTSAAIGISGAVNAVKAGSEQPNFHIGHRSADEMSIRIRSRERVMTPLGMETAASNGAVADLNAGVGSAPRAYSLTLGHRSLGEVIVEQLRDSGSALAQATRSAHPRKLGRA